MFLHGDYQQLIRDLESILEDFSTQLRGKFVKISTTSTQDFRSLTKHLDNFNQEYHTFRSPDTSKLSLMVRNIPYSLSNEEIYKELVNLSYPVLQVTRLYKRDRMPMPLCAIEVENSDQGIKMLQLDRLFHSIVKVEKRRPSSSVPQCTRCQHYGHTKNYCKREPRCVRCEGNHHYKNCNVPRSTASKCVNCKDDHPANFKGCTYYQTIISRQNARPLRQSIQSRVSPPPPCRS